MFWFLAGEISGCKVFSPEYKQIVQHEYISGCQRCSSKKKTLRHHASGACDFDVYHDGSSELAQYDFFEEFQHLYGDRQL
ncbi:hypothetical protein D3C78_877630 [compost metagenome]